MNYKKGGWSDVEEEKKGKTFSGEETEDSKSSVSPFYRTSSSESSDKRYFEEFDEIEDVDESEEFDDDADELDFSVEPVLFAGLPHGDAPGEDLAQVSESYGDFDEKVPDSASKHSPDLSGLQDFSILFEDEPADDFSSNDFDMPGSVTDGVSVKTLTGNLFSGFDESVFEEEELDVEITAIPDAGSEGTSRVYERTVPENEQEEKFYDEAALGRMIFGDAEAEETPDTEAVSLSEEERLAWENNIFRKIENGANSPSLSEKESGQDPLAADEQEESPETSVRKTPPGETAKTGKNVFSDRKQLMQKIKPYLSETVMWVLVAAAVIFVVNIASIYVLRRSVVSGHSMDPTLYDGETIMLSKLPYVFGDIERGDIIVIDRQEDRQRTFFVEFREVLRYSLIARLFVSEDTENDENVFWVKRVIGIEGDVISFENGKLYRNGEIVEEEYLYTQEITTYPNVVFTIGEGEIFVMGDNRNNSLDSRYLTVPIKVDHVVGKVVGLSK